MLGRLAVTNMLDRESFLAEPSDEEVGDLNLIFDHQDADAHDKVALVPTRSRIVNRRRLLRRKDWIVGRLILRFLLLALFFLLVVVLVLLALFFLVVVLVLLLGLRFLLVFLVFILVVENLAVGAEDDLDGLSLLHLDGQFVDDLVVLVGDLFDLGDLAFRELLPPP